MQKTVGVCLRWTLLLTLATCAWGKSRVGSFLSRQPGANHVQRRGTVVVLLTPPEQSRSFLPSQAFGAGVDGHGHGEIAQLFSPVRIQAMRGAGFQQIAYRLRTELAVHAWHWNPNGSWSDPTHQEGYWTSDEFPASPIVVSYGYRLPRRGNTFDQDYNNDYSRLDDGDHHTFWKSNPYLDQHFTHEATNVHPQWVIVDLKRPRKINAIQILWGAPYATEFTVEYSNRWHPGMGINELGIWTKFPDGSAKIRTREAGVMQVSSKPVSARFVRLLMTAGSGDCSGSPNDVRNCVGFAIRELYVGLKKRNSTFHDLVHHFRSRFQTTMYVSSTDPWHRSTDRDVDLEQPGFDRLFQSSLTRNLPVLVPVPLLYDVPENAAAEVRYLRTRGYRIEGIEMGEEPNGQYIEGADYGALYVQWCAAIRSADEKARIGGPSLSGLGEDDMSWMSAFINYLEARGHLSDYHFFSFEWYPFSNANSSAGSRLVHGRSALENALIPIRRDERLRKLPWFMTEYGYSDSGGPAQVGMTSAIFNTETVAQFLLLGGRATYLYGYEPGKLIGDPSSGWDTHMILQVGENQTDLYQLASYQAARLMTTEWAQPTDLPHELQETTSDISNKHGDQLVSAYAVLRPDKKWAIMLINKDTQKAWQTRVLFRDPLTGRERGFQRGTDLYQFSSAQYSWLDNGSHSHPQRSRPARHTSWEPKDGCCVRLPPLSISVVRGQITE